MIDYICNFELVDYEVNRMCDMYLIGFIIVCVGIVIKVFDC